MQTDDKRGVCATASARSGYRHAWKGTPRLAPLYDLISTAVYPGLGKKLAMKIGGENRPEYVRARHLARFADDLGGEP